MDNKARPALARRAFVARALAAGRLITPFALPLTLSYWLVSPPAALKGWPPTLAVS